MSQKDDFAVVEFDADENQPHKRLVEVIKYSWLTDDGNKCFCPKSKNWSYELENHGLPREDWVKYNCRVLKYNIATIHAANIECSKILNYVKSELSDDEITGPSKGNGSFPDASINLNYNDLFDKKSEEYYAPPASATSQSDKVDIEATVTKTSVNGTICVNFDSLQTALQELAELKKSHQTLSIKLDQMDSNIEKLMAQSEIMMKIQIESCKRTPNASSFVPVINIDSKEKLNDLEIQLGNEDFFQNMAYAFTQYAFKGDAKKEVNGFVKSILLRLLDDNFSQQVKWDRVRKLDETLPAGEDVSDKIFFKKYTKILDFITEVCNKNRKDLQGFYNKDNICQATQDFFKRQSYKKK